MAEIPNLTGRIAELREHKKTAVLQGSGGSKSPRHQNAARQKASPDMVQNKLYERRVASSFLVTCVYALLFLGLAGQLLLIAILDLL